jgi:hypothetical protein
VSGSTATALLPPDEPPEHPVHRTVNHWALMRRALAHHLALPSAAFAHVDVDYIVYLSANTSAIPGETLTQRNLSMREARRGALQAIDAVASASVDDAVPVAEWSKSAAKALLKLLPDGSPMPKVAVDGEGGLMLLWKLNAPLIAVLTGGKLHLVVRAGQPDVRYVENIEFAGLELPEALVSAISEISTKHGHSGAGRNPA